ncbi:MAG: nucleoside-diphosphate kinase [bacterium]|nr:nucleoside-diphosphate kinase [bacterium]
MIERTFVMIKPDGVKRSLIGEVIKRFENVGLKLIGMKMLWIDKDFASKHYTEDISIRRGERVRNDMISYAVEGPVIAMVWEGVQAIEVVRKLVGGTEPKLALPGTIRGDFTHVSFAYADNKRIAVRNVIHASGDAKDAAYEIQLWFSEEDLFKYKTVHEQELH